MANLNAAGTFKAVPTDWSLQEGADGKGLSVAIRWRVIAMRMNDGSWEDWSTYEVTSIVGYSTLIKKDGTPNDRGIEDLCRAIGWRGTLDEIDQPPPYREAEIVCEFEEYKGAQTLRVKWVNPIGGGALKKLDPMRAKALRTQYGSSIRAIASRVPKPVDPAGAVPAQAPASEPPFVPEPGQEPFQP